MNRRQAKRRACYMAAAALQCTREAGWEWDEGWSDDDVARITAALDELQDELYWRGPRDGDPRPRAAGEDER